MDSGGSPLAARLSADTDRAAEDRQIEIWRTLSTAQVAQLVNNASRNVRTIALAGFASRHPSASPHELIVRLAEITLGRELAVRVYPELEQFEP